MLEHQLCNIICRIELDGEGAEELKEKIEDEYMVHVYGNLHLAKLDAWILSFAFLFNELSMHLIGSLIPVLWFTRLEFLNMSLHLLISLDFIWGLKGIILRQVFSFCIDELSIVV